MSIGSNVITKVSRGNRGAADIKPMTQLHKLGNPLKGIGALHALRGIHRDPYITLIIDRRKIVEQRVVRL